jgi:hypothetical protein
MCDRFDQIRSHIHPHSARGTVKIHKLKIGAVWAICAVFTGAFLLVSFTWIDHAQNHSVNYTFTSTSSDVLNAYVRFTGTQFLIINKNQFAWTNVRIEISSGTSQDHHLHGPIGPRALMLMAPRINTGEAYAVGVTQFRRDEGTTFDPVTTRPQNIKIWSDTPRGRGFWSGRVTDVIVGSQMLSGDEEHHTSRTMMLPAHRRVRRDFVDVPHLLPAAPL